MSSHSGLETESDTELIKEFALYPILLDMLRRDADELAMYDNKIVFIHLTRYLQEVEQLLHSRLVRLKQTMKIRHIAIISRELTAQGIQIEYRIRGYTHHFEMMRSRIKAELMLLLEHLRGRLQ